MLYRSNILSAGLGFICCFLLVPLGHQVFDAITASPKEVIEHRNRTIWHISRCLEALHQNSDLMARFNHYTHEGHNGNAITCPECSGYVYGIGPGDYIFPKEGNLPFTYEQIMADNHEVEAAISTIWESLLIQRDTLALHLRYLRQGFPYETPAPLVTN